MSSEQARETRQTLTVRLPAGFDPAEHADQLGRVIAREHGDGWEVDRIDVDKGVAVASRARQVALTQVDTNTAGDRFQVPLAKDTKTSAAEAQRAIARLEDTYDGYTVVTFDPLRRFAELAKLTAAELRCRDAVSTVIGVQPWNVQVTADSNGGFDLVLSAKYVPSKHDEGLVEVATAVVGTPGWRIRIDAAALTAKIIPGAPPSFPAQIDYPYDQPVTDVLAAGDDWGLIPLGYRLPESGAELGEVCYADFGQSAHGQMSGIQGSGKSGFLVSLIGGVLRRGWELALVDPIKEGIDFVPFQEFVVDGGWGCESTPEAVTTLQMAYNEGLRRKKLVKHYQVRKWTELPAGVAVRPRLVIVDETSSVLAAEKVPKGDSPIRTEIEERNLWRSAIESLLGKISRELRYVGICLLVTSQVSSKDTGLAPALRTNLGQKFLMGAKPTPGNRRLSLSDPDGVPTVPRWIAEDKKASAGVGVAEIGGWEPCVFKAFWAELDTMAQALQQADLPITERPAPTPGEVHQHCPELDPS